MKLTHINFGIICYNMSHITVGILDFVSFYMSHITIDCQYKMDHLYLYYTVQIIDHDKHEKKTVSERQLTCSCISQPEGWPPVDQRCEPKNILVGFHCGGILRDYNLNLNILRYL